MTIKIDFDDDGETDVTITRDQVKRFSLIVKGLIGSLLAAIASFGCLAMI